MMLTKERSDVFLRELKIFLKEKIGLFNPYNFNNFPERFFCFPLSGVAYPTSTIGNNKILQDSFWVLYNVSTFNHERYTLDIAARLHPEDERFIECYCNVNTQGLFEKLAYDFPDRMNNRRWHLLVNSVYQQENSSDILALNYLFSLR